MKKILSLILAAMMIFGCVMALAEDTVSSPSTDVTVTEPVIDVPADQSAAADLLAAAAAAEYPAAVFSAETQAALSSVTELQMNEVWVLTALDASADTVVGLKFDTPYTADQEVQSVLVAGEQEFVLDTEVADDIVYVTFTADSLAAMQSAGYGVLAILNK